MNPQFKKAIFARQANAPNMRMGHRFTTHTKAFRRLGSDVYELNSSAPYKSKIRWGDRTRDGVIGYGLFHSFGLRNLFMYA